MNTIHKFWHKVYIDPRKRRKLRRRGLELLSIVDKAMKEAGVPYSLHYGTMLGALREKGFIPHDFDIDIALFADEDYSEAFKKLYDAGFSRERQILVDEGAFGREDTLRYKSLSVDFFWLYPDGEGGYYGTEFYPQDGCTGWKDSIAAKGGLKVLVTHSPVCKETRYVPFESTTLPVMNEALAFVKDHYGPNWQIPDPDFKYPRKGENRYEEPEDKIAIIRDRNNIPNGKHAYLILAHQRFGQLRKLLGTLDDPRNDIFVHVDKRSSFNPEEWKDACKNAGLYFIPKRYRVHWGGFSIIRSELELLRESTANGKYEYYHLLSGMDLPIKSQDAIHAFFKEHAGSEFLNFWKPEGIESRFMYYTPLPERNRNFVTRFINSAAKRLQMLVGFSINKGIDFKYASQWFSITDECASYVLSMKDWIEKTFRHASICDEIFLATLVWNSPFKDRLYDATEADKQSVNESSMRYLDWRSEGGRYPRRHPRIFTAGDFDMLMKVPHMWARKFDEKTDGKIIDMICNSLK